MSSYTNFTASTRKIICIGRNYVAHIKELNNPQPSEPFFFLKPPSSLLKTGGTVLLPRGIESHFEVELGLVISRKSTDLEDDPQVAKSVIGGYFLAIDMTARNLQDENKRKGMPWTTAKGFDTYCPVSKFIPAANVSDPHDVTLKLSVNGVVKQHDSTGLMIYRIPKILSHVSSIMTLDEGDLVLTGTPAGVGRVVHGDVMECEAWSSGKELVDARIRVDCKDRTTGYQFSSSL